MTMKQIKITAIGTCLSLTLTALPAVAQDGGDSAQSGQSGQSAQQGTQSGQSDTSGTSGTSGTSNEQAQSAGAQSAETVVAMVGDTEILGADVIEFISTLPPRMRQQPPQILMSMALDQVILRELLLQEAQAQNLAEDPRVTEIVERNAQVAQEDAMVAVFLEDQLAERVSDEQVQQTYEQLQDRTAEDQTLPPLDALRPQIEQQLQQQALQTLHGELAQNVDVVVYGAGQGSSQSGNASSGSGEGATDSGSASSESQ